MNLQRAPSGGVQFFMFSSFIVIPCNYEHMCNPGDACPFPADQRDATPS